MVIGDAAARPSDRWPGIIRRRERVVDSTAARSGASANQHTIFFASLDQWWIVAFALFTIVLVYVIEALAANKPFWHDEIYTILFADLPSLHTMWRAANDGIDLSPPLNAMLTHVIHPVVGTGRLATRLPPLVGYWTMTLVLFDVVRRRSHVVAALSAAALPCLSEAFRYSTEARGYGVMLGLFAVALWSWSEAARARNRRLHLPLLALALAAGLWNQYFAILAFAPILIGEALRVRRAQAIDWGVAGAIGGALLAVLPLRDLMHVAAAHGATYWRHARISDIGPTYELLFNPLLGGFLAIAVVLAAVLVLAGIVFGSRASVRCEYRELPVHEIGAGLATLAVPVGAVLLGVYGSGVFVPRYALAGVIGLSVVLPLLIARAGSHRGIADIVLSTALIATFCGSAYQSVVAERRIYRDPMAARPILLQQLSEDGPVAVSATTEYLQLWYYTPPELRGRLVYLDNPVAALEETGSDTVDRNYLALRRWSPVSIVDYDTFIAGHRTFRVYVPGPGWLIKRLRASGASLEEIGREADGPIYRVTLEREEPAP